MLLKPTHGEERPSRVACWMPDARAGSSGCSIGALRRATNGYTRASSAMMLRGSADRAGAVRRAAGADVLGLRATARAVHSRRRTWATCWSTCNCPTRRRVERTQAVVKHIGEIVARPRQPGVDAYHRRSSGQSFMLERRRLELRVRCSSSSSRSTSGAIRSSYYRGDRKIGSRKRFAERSAAKRAWLLFGPPPCSGVGNAGGFTMMIEDRGDLGLHGAAGSQHLADDRCASAGRGRTTASRERSSRRSRWTTAVPRRRETCSTSPIKAERCSRSPT